MRKRKNFKITNKQSYTKLGINIILLLIFILESILFINASLNKKSSFSYTENGNIDYKVYLKENEFWKDEYLGKNMTYVTSLVDYIDVNFDYNFNVNQNSNINYTYSVFANLIITPEENSEVLFNEKYVLEDNISERFTNIDKYNINKTIKVDYGYYNDIANKFKSTYGLNCNGKLFIGLQVDTKGKDLKYETEFNNSNDMKICFTLAKKQVSINKEKEALNTQKDINNQNAKLIKNKGKFAIGIIFIFISILQTINIIKNIYEITSKKDGYTKYIDKLLNNYDRAIVETQYMPNLEDYEVLEVSKFEELLDVRDTLRVPIIYTPIKDKEKESCFYIKHENSIFIYYVKSTSLAKVRKIDRFL